MEQDSLLNQALNECKILHQSGKISWYSNLTNILNCFNIDKDISELSNLKSEIKKHYEEFWKINIKRIRVITKLPNSEQSYKGKVKTHNYINRQNQSETYIRNSCIYNYI